MILTMYDDINADNIPADATVMAGYVDGQWPSYAPMKTRFPNARVFSITVYNGDADILDVETGDATPDMVPAWVTRQRNAGRPIVIVYCNRSNYPAVVQACLNANVRVPPIWLAQYDNDPTIPDYAAGKQYQSTPNYDVSSIDTARWPGLSGIGEINVQSTDFFRHFEFKEGGYCHIRRNGEADIPPGQEFHPYSVLRADGAVFSFPYNGLWAYSQLPANLREVASPDLDYIVDIWQ